MNRLIVPIFAALATVTLAQEDLRGSLETTYNAWRDSMLKQDSAQWQRVTAENRRVEVQNRILSEKRPFPAAIFDVPAPPPPLAGLKFLQAKQNGPTAKASYFGKIDFGVGGEPMENLLVLSFVKGNGGWLYERADFANLAALPEARKELLTGNLKYLDENPDAQPSGKAPLTPIVVPPAKHIAKVYVFCPGREVVVQINKVSRHRFANAKEAETVIGGARGGANEVEYTTKKLEGGTGKEALTIRVYLIPDNAREDPNKAIKAFQYQVEEGEEAKALGSGTFTVDPATAVKLGP